jgi:outer membrane protein OmpA-like peptidoglycan-associated protein
VRRKYTVDEIARSPEARDAVARIEIDTVHFGFGEGFLREEEIDKLDRIAQVLERILAKNSEEVFMIEGHTDAVGSDASNLQLSRQRAQAVKEALTTYYVIPAENLKTVGLGERYLKIPTQQAEAENRRVSLARITPLVGQLD